MNPTRLVFLLTGMGLILIAGAVAYYQTPLHRNIPEGAAIATLLVIAGIFVMFLANETRRSHLASTAPDTVVAERSRTTVIEDRPRTRVVETGPRAPYERIERY